MKTKLLFPMILALGAFLSIESSAQAVGDYRSNAVSFVWNTATNWQRWNGATWVTNPPQGFPGQIASPGTVTIQTGHTVTANLDITTFDIGNLTLQGTAILNMNTGIDLEVTGTLTMDGTSQINGGSTTRTITAAALSVPVTSTGSTITTILLTINGPATVTGTFTLGGTTATINGATTVSGTLTLNSDSGVKTFVGAVSNSGTWTSTAISTSGNLVFRNGVSSTGANFAAGAATFNTTAAQIIGGNAAMSFSGVVSIGAGITVTNNNTNTVTMSNSGIALASGGAGSTFTQGSTGNTLSYGGSSIGVDNFNSTGANNTVIFSGSVTQTINGIGTFSFVNLTLAASGIAHVNVAKNISISGILNFTAANARLLVVDANSNVTLGTAATITNVDSGSYVQLDGTTGTNSNLIKTTTASTAPWAITFPIGTSIGGYSPITIPTVTTNPTLNSTLSVKAINKGSTIGQLRRVFRLVVAGNAAATTFSNAVFNYNNTTDISAGDSESNYTTVWRLASGGVWTNIATIGAPTNQFTVAGGSAATASLTTGTYYYTIGTTTGYPGTWYSYQNGNFSDPNVWTLDPSGTTIDNPLNIAPQPGDEIAILNGITVTNDVSNVILGSTIIEAGGTLDMASTTGNTLGIVTGQGVLRVNGIALPSGTYTAFVANTGGTIEYYNTGGTLPATQTTYNKLKMTNSTGSNIIYAMGNNLTVNGTFDITATGAGTVTWQINNGTANRRTIILNGNLTVSTNGRIRASASGVTGPHLLTMFGNLVNNGSIKFFDDTDTQLEDADYTSGATFTTALKNNAVNVTFSGATDQSITCNSQTDFYRLIMDKGTGQQAVLEVTSSATTNFRLFGPNNLGSSGAAPNSVSNNSLSIVNGTLKLSGNINISNLTEGGGSFPIPQNGFLWMNSPNVTVQVTSNNVGGGGNSRMIIDYGQLRVTDGTLNMGYSRGLLGGQSGQFIIEGGTVNAWQIRTTNLGSGNNFAYTQSGGTVNVGTTGLSGETIDGYPRFALPYSTCSFVMTGGTLNIASPISIATTINGGIGINSSSSNFIVTGGTINCYIPTTGVNFGIASTVPFYNLNVLDQGGAGSVSLASVNIDDGVAGFTINATPLQVLNNLTLVTGNNPVFTGNGQNVSIGGNFEIQASTTFTPGANVVTFNGSGAQSWTHNGTITSLSSVVVNKTTGTTLTLSGANTFPNISNALTLTSGTLADGGKTITVTGTLSNSATHSGSGSITYSNGAASTISGNGGTFGNLTITTSFTHATSGNQTVTGNLRLTNANTTLNIASNSLTVLGNIYSDASPGTAVAFTATKRILTSGLHNAGGLTRQGVSGDLLFPVGTGALYTPNTINVTATTHGTITVRPVNSEHPNVTTTGQVVRYYWRVTSSGYAGISAVTHKSYNYSTATEDNPTANYRSARYDRTVNSWATNNTVFNATASPPIPNFSTGTGWTGVTGDQLDGEYTCGNIAAFGAITVYYSRASGNWNVNATWSTDNVLKHTGTAAASNPTSCPTCPVIIGDGSSNNHTITTVAASACGSLTLSTGSTLDCSTFTGHNFGTSTGGSVTGTGLLRIAAVGAGVANMFPAGDFTNFLGTTGGTVEWYGATKTIPATGPAPQNLSLSTYFNLLLNPTTGQTITLPATNLTIYNNWTQGSPSTFGGSVLTNGARSLTINGNLTVSGTSGRFNFSNAAASATTLTVVGNTTIGTGAGMAVVAGGTANTNTFTTSGNITNNGTIGFRNTGVVNLVFTGSNDVSFTGTGSVAVAPNGTTLNLVVVNKGTSQVPTVLFNVGGTITTTAVAGGWLTLTNGTFHFNTSSTTTISTSSYTIPSTARLKVSSGSVFVMTADNDANDLFLNGTLEISGGNVAVGNTAGSATTNTDIEYASAGNPTITVSSGSLVVKSSIRRSTTNLAGALVYNQTGGSVTVAGIDANNTRGVFEIDANPGSSFTLTGNGTLNILRQTNGTGYADVFINPIISNVSSTSTIAVGLTTATTQANLRVNMAPSIGNFTVQNGAGTNAQTVNLFSNPLILAGTLTIPTPSRLITNSLDVFIAGDLVCTGTYTGGTNTTTFNGTGAQAASLSASSQFTNMTISKTGGTTVTLSGTAPTLTNLNILTGILDVGALTLNVNGDVTNNSSQTGAGSIVMSGASATHNIYSNSGSFTNLTLLGSVNKVVTVNGNTNINGVLNFGAANRYLMIKSNQLSFGPASSVTGSGATAFIRTNGVSSDLGVSKTFAIGTSSFNYAVGTLFTYTPVSYTLNTTTAGTLSVTPVNSRHPTYNSSSPEQILNYYWIVTKGGLVATATANHTYSYPASLLGGVGGSLVAGYLDISNPAGWITSGHGGTATTTQMSFNNAFPTNIPSPGTTYNYTVGTVNTLPNPIVPVYSRFAGAGVSDLNTGGNWTSVSSWTTSPTGVGAAVVFAPSGVPVVILSGARINTNLDGRRAFAATINGLLSIGTTVGHNLGILSGTGTMRTATNTFPAGNFTAFVAASGGTIEYVAPMTMNSRTTYNNLSVFSGSAGTVTMTASDLVLNGNLTIPVGVTLDNANNRDISIAGSWSNSGTYTPGTGTVTFNGSAVQNISGANSFGGFRINKPSGNVTLSGTGTTTVSGSLTLTAGNIISSSINTLALGTSATTSGGSSSSFVVGPMTKTLAASGTFIAPLGSITATSSPAIRYRPATIASTSGADTWSFEYVGSSPTTGGFDNSLFVNLGTVSNYEYWLISRAGATTADLTLTYNTGSYSGSDILSDGGTLPNLRVARWDGAQWDVPPGGGTPSQSGTAVAGTISITGVTSFSPVTNATLDAPSALPVELLSFTGKVVHTGIELQWKTATEINNDYFNVEKLVNNEKYVSIGKIKGKGTTAVLSQYQYVDEYPSQGRSYYRLKQTDFDGKFTYSNVISIDYEGSDMIKISIYPNPAKGDEITLEIKGLKDINNLPLSICDPLGRQFLSADLQVDALTGSVKRTISTKEMSDGMYILKVGTTNIQVRRIIIAR